MSDWPKRPESTHRPLPVGGERLRSCPFCASAKVDLYEHSYAKLFAIVCRSCGAEGPSRESPVKAIQLWNGRSA